MARSSSPSRTVAKKAIKRGPGRPAKASLLPEPDQGILLKLYEQMLLIRRFEEKAGQLYGMGQIGGFCHLYIGQEAVVVGMQSVAEPKDTVVTSYRDHGHMLACGMDANGVMAELTGREGGYSRGKGGSMHMFSREKNFFGGHGIVGAQVPIGIGRQHFPQQPLLPLVQSERRCFRTTHHDAAHVDETVSSVRVPLPCVLSPERRHPCRVHRVSICSNGSNSCESPTSSIANWSVFRNSLRAAAFGSASAAFAATTKAVRTGRLRGSDSAGAESRNLVTELLNVIAMLLSPFV